MTQIVQKLKVVFIHCSIGSEVKIITIPGVKTPSCQVMTQGSGGRGDFGVTLIEMITHKVFVS